MSSKNINPSILSIYLGRASDGALLAQWHSQNSQNLNNGSPITTDTHRLSLTETIKKIFAASRSESHSQNQTGNCSFDSDVCVNSKLGVGEVKTLSHSMISPRPESQNLKPQRKFLDPNTLNLMIHLLKTEDNAMLVACVTKDCMSQDCDTGDLTSDAFEHVILQLRQKLLKSVYNQTNSVIMKNISDEGKFNVINSNQRFQNQNGNAITHESDINSESSGERSISEHSDSDDNFDNDYNSSSHFDFGGIRHNDIRYRPNMNKRQRQIQRHYQSPGGKGAGNRINRTNKKMFIDIIRKNFGGIVNENQVDSETDFQNKLANFNPSINNNELMLSQKVAPFLFSLAAELEQDITDQVGRVLEEGGPGPTNNANNDTAINDPNVSLNLNNIVNGAQNLNYGSTGSAHTNEEQNQNPQTSVPTVAVNSVNNSKTSKADPVTVTKQQYLSPAFINEQIQNIKFEDEDNDDANVRSSAANAVFKGFDDDDDEDDGNLDDDIGDETQQQGFLTDMPGGSVSLTLGKIKDEEIIRMSEKINNVGLADEDNPEVTTMDIADESMPQQSKQQQNQLIQPPILNPFHSTNPHSPSYIGPNPHNHHHISDDPRHPEIDDPNYYQLGQQDSSPMGGPMAPGDELSEADKLARLQDKTEEIKEVMRENVNNLLSNTEELDMVNADVVAMAHEANEYKEEAEKIEEYFWYKDTRLQIFLAVIGLIFGCSMLYCCGRLCCPGFLPSCCGSSSKKNIE